MRGVRLIYTWRLVKGRGLACSDPSAKKDVSENGDLTIEAMFGSCCSADQVKVR